MPDDSNSDNERVQVSVWVDEDMREQWDEYAEELGFESRGALIRNAVRYFYVAQKEGASKRVLKKLDSVEDGVDRTESKVDSVKIDQLEQQDIELIASEVEFSLMKEFMRVLGEADSVADIEPLESDDV